jgi:hypothetical protein
MSYLTTAINPDDPSLRGNEIQYNVQPQTVDTSLFEQSIGSTPQAALTGSAPSVSAPTAPGAALVGTPQQVQYSGVDQAGFQHDPNIQTGNTQQAALDFFNSNLPQMNIDFRDQSDALAQRTAAMGRTGSGLFNRDTDYLSDRSLAQRESMLGNIGYQSIQADANRALQGDIAREGMIGQNLGLLSQLANANATGSLQAGLANQSAGLQSSLANQGALNTMGMFGAEQQQQAGMFNAQQQAAMQQLNAQMQNAMMQSGMQTDTSRLGLLSSLMGQNAQTLNQDQLNQQQWASGERSYQDQLANQAMMDQQNQIGMLNPAAQWGYDPYSGMGDLTSLLLGGSGQYGANAGMLGGQLSGLLSALIPTLFGGGTGG